MVLNGITILWFCTLVCTINAQRSEVFKEYGCYKHMISKDCLHADCSGIKDYINWTELGKIPKLCSLNISNTGLRNFPSELSDPKLFKDLKYLEATHNEIKHIPTEFSYRFIQINVSHNQISDLPKVTNISMTKLEYSDVSHNNLTSIGSLDTDFALNITSKGNPMKCDSPEHITSIWNRMAKGQLDLVRCMEDGSTEMKLIPQVTSYQKPINDKTNESEGYAFWPLPGVVIIVAVVVVVLVVVLIVCYLCLKPKKRTNQSEHAFLHDTPTPTEQV